MSHDSESLRIAAVRHKAYNDSIAPPMSTGERTRGHLRDARRDLDRYSRCRSADPALSALHAAVSSMLEALELGR